MAAQSCKVLVPSGVLGSGCPDAAMSRGVALKPDVIAVDAGSTDSGPHYLGAGVSKMTRKAVKRDLRQLMRARDELGVPLLIGSCGTSGTDRGVDWMAEICREIASEYGLSARLALIYSELSAEKLQPYLLKGAIKPLPPAEPITETRLRSCSRIVSLLGYEPLAAAVETGADIVLSGRTTDTAVLAAVPILRGCPAAAAWHAAKIAECGGLCTTQSRMGGVMLTIDADGFEVEPLHPDNACTVRSVAAHLFYENADPFRLKEPGVLLDASTAKYDQITDRSVRVTGSRLEIKPCTMKLEGAGPIGFRTMIFVAIADPKVLNEADRWLRTLESFLRAGIASVLEYDADAYDLDMRAYGWNALNTTAARDGAPPREIGLMLLVTAKSQEIASEIARYCNPYLLHFPLNTSDPLPSFAFPYSPAEVEMGQIYEFKLNHVVEVTDWRSLSTTVFETIENEKRHVVA